MERVASHRYRWEETVLDSKAAKAEAKSGTPGAEYLMLRQQVAQAMDTTGWGTILVMIDVTLSVFSVILYIAMTYHPLNALYHCDLALACIFSLNWAFWFWIAEDRLRYIFSFLTLVDVVTIVPAFVLYGLGATVAETVPGLNFLRVLRILRVLRVFRMKHIMRRHLEGAVMEAAGKLVFSLLSIVFIAAGLFYELEKYGPQDDEKHTQDLKFHQSIYWATVTLTTVGYGDIVPTYWATQVMLIALLMLTFTLLPYLTGQLMDALTSTSTYQRRSFKPSRRSDVSHVVITGFLDGATVQGVLDELYHEDKGFNHNHTVLLSERPPSHDVQHVLATHNASRKLSYLQGSPFRPEDWRRTGAEYSSAVFIIAPKYPEDPTTADRYLAMCALSLGQYLQEAHVKMEERLSHTPNRVMHWFKHGTVLPPEQLPAVYLQVCLPEGRLRLFQILQSLQDRHCKPASTATAAAAGAAAAAGSKPHCAAGSKLQHQQKQQYGASAAGDATAAGADQEDDTALVADDAAAAGECDTLNDTLCDSPNDMSAPSASQPSSFNVTSSAPSGYGSSHAVGSGFSSPTFGVPRHAAARSDTAHGFNGDAAVDLSAFSETSMPAAKSDAHHHERQLQQHAQQHGGWFGWVAWCFTGAQQQEQQVPEPATHAKALSTGTQFWQEFSGYIHVLCLSEIKYAMMAQSVVGVPGALTMLCNLSTTVDFGYTTMEDMEALPPWLRDYMIGASQEVYKLHTFPTTLVGRTVKEAAGFVFDSCHAVLLAVEKTEGLQRHRMIVGDLEMIITPDMHGYLVADDVSSVLLISAAQEGDFELWHQLRQQHLLAAAQQGKSNPSTNPSSKSGKSQSQKGSTKSRVKTGGGQQGWKAALMKSSSLHMPEGPLPRHKLAAMVPQRRTDPERYDSRYSLLDAAPGIAMPGHTQPVVLEPSELEEYARLQQQQHLLHQQQQQQPAGWTSAVGGAEQPALSCRGHAPSPVVAAVAEACQASGVTNVARRVASGHASALGALIHLLRSPSRQLRKQGEAFLRQHYHMRPPGSVQWDKWRDPNMEVDLSELSGHIIVLGVPASQDGLLSLLAVLRSKRLLQWRPVVIVDSNMPIGGGSWEAVAQFSDVYFIQAGNGLNDALLRASAERAAQAILMTPLVSHDYDDEDHRLASKVMTDALVVNRYQLLKSINPSIELVTELMMPQSVSFLTSTMPVRGVDHRYLHLLSPAYMSGSVFHARLLDDLMIASYCNGASDRLVLQLLHRWHMGWAGVQAFSTLAKEQQEVMPDSSHLLQTLGQVPQQQQELWQQEYQTVLQQQQQQQQQQQTGTVQGSDAISTASANFMQARQQVQQEHFKIQKFKVAATAVLNQLSKAAGVDLAPAAAAQIAARAVEQRGVPMLMQIPIDCAPGTTYGRYFHMLLHSRGLLLLGVHRLVYQDGLSFRATITNPDYHSELQPGDRAFVVARLHLPADPSDRAAVAAAWPPDTLGFSNLDPQPPQQPDLWAPPAAAAAAAAAGPRRGEGSFEGCDAAASGGGSGRGVSAAAVTLQSLNSGPLADADFTSAAAAAAAAAAQSSSAPNPRHDTGASAAAGGVGLPAGHHHTVSSSGNSHVHSHPLYAASASPTHVHPANPAVLHGPAGSGYMCRSQDIQAEDVAHAAAWAGGASSSHGVPAMPGESFGGSSGQQGRRGMLAKMPGVQGSVMHNAHQSDASISAGKQQGMVSPRGEQPE